MLKSENKTTGDRLSIIPEYTLNSTLSWQAREDLSMQTTLDVYKRQGVGNGLFDIRQRLHHAINFAQFDTLPANF